MRKPFRELLAMGAVLVCDGAMGTMLQGGGTENVSVPELLNLVQPERVLEVHRQYLAAGADIITTNTFGGNSLKMARAGVAEKMAEANRAAVTVARRAAGDDRYVAGDMGPTGELLEPYGELTVEAATEAYAAQAMALAEGGVDLFLIETMSDLAEVTAAVAGIRRVSDLPLMCTLSFESGGRTMMGVSPRQAAEALASLELDGFGANCGQGPEDMEAVVVQMLAAVPGAVVIAQPNAGLPTLVDGRTVYDATPERMGQQARRYAQAGVRVLGSCCGSTPAHTSAIAQAVADLRGRGG